MKWQDIPIGSEISWPGYVNTFIKISDTQFQYNNPGGVIEEVDGGGSSWGIVKPFEVKTDIIVKEKD